MAMTQRNLDHFIQASLGFCRQESIIRQLRSVPRCSEGKENACDVQNTQAIRCKNCQQRFLNRPKYKQAIRRRSSAKQTLMYWYSRIEGKA